MQALTGIRGGDLPGDGVLLRVALRLQGGGPLAPGVQIGARPSETATRQDANRDFGHIEPTAMLGSGVEREALAQPVRLLRRERGTERRRAMGVEVVLH